MVCYFFSAPPSPELVKRVRELYHRNSSDVRFLIPVLHGLQKVGVHNRTYVKYFITYVYEIWRFKM